MKKNFLFILSMAIAFGITLYIKSEKSKISEQANNREWKTYIKKSGPEVVVHKTTDDEFEAAKITPPIEEDNQNVPTRSIASVNPLKGFMVRKDRILMGEIDQKYEDENTPLEMVNKINPAWKDIMGKNLMRFQPDETKLMVKEEVPVIKIQEGTGRYLQQVIITYMQKSGFKSSFRALVDSDSGVIIETWDRSIYEAKLQRGDLSISSEVDNGIITK